MTDRILIRGGIVLTQDPKLGEMAGADVLIEDDKIVDVGSDLSADDARVIDAAGRHRHPGLHRHAPAHVGDVHPNLRPGLRADHLLRLDPRQVRAALSARRCLLVEPVGIARVHQRGHHHARRLGAHHEHAGACRRGDPRAQGVGHPIGLRVRLPEHLAPGLVVRPGLRRQRADLRRRRRATHQGAVLQLGQGADHDGPRHPRPRILQAGRRAPRLGAGEGARGEHHGPRRDGPIRLHQGPDHGAARHGPALLRDDVRACLALHR